MIPFIFANAVWPLLILLPFVLIKAKPWARILCALVVVLFAASCGQMLALRQSNYRAVQQSKWTSEILTQLAEIPEPERTEKISQIADRFGSGSITKEDQKEIESIIKIANNESMLQIDSSI